MQNTGSNIGIIPRTPHPKPRYKKSAAVKELETMAFEEAKQRHPSIDPKYLAPRTYRDDRANGLTKCIVDYITLRGGMASRINSSGVWDKKLNKYRIPTQKRGLADIWATYRGLSLQIEVKIGRDRQSEHQKQVEQQQTDAGGLYYIARNFSEFKEWFDSL
jgi:hypothetical protein